VGKYEDNESKEGPPRSPSSADNKAVKLMLEGGNAVEDAGKTTCVIEGSVRRYSRRCAKWLSERNVFATSENR
jgi:hypothetical protein